MSDAETLFNLVQPSDGWTCIVGIKEGSVKQEFAETFEAANSIISKFQAADRNVFFGVAKYKNNKSRAKDNVKALKAFWLDIDCGADKAVKGAGYEDQSAGLAALREVCSVIGLPIPTVVNSGRGLHIYWPLTDAVTREEWEPVADKLKSLCKEHGLLVDPAVFEAARILRVPGTLNFKDDPPKEVTLLKTSAPVKFAEFKALLGAEEAPAPIKATRPLSPLAQSLQNDFPKSFKKILEGGKCQQLLSCVIDRTTLSEPRWFDALSIAQFCEDREDAITEVSEDHPGYNFSFAEKKAAHSKGPHTCKVFDQNNPGVCTSCPLWGKITSPIVLGIVSGEPVEEVTSDGTTYTIPKPPSGYIINNTGLWLSGNDEGGEQQHIYEHTFYVLKRMRDPNIGEVTIIRAHLPHDGVQEFSLPNSIIGERSELKAELAKHGIICMGKKFDMLMVFILASVKNLQYHRKAEQMRLQFGWADKDSKFIIGDREITADGIYHSPPSTATATIAPYMTPTGSLEKWKEVFSLYGRKGLEPHAFAALTAFGSPLLKFLGQRGALINLINSRSGQGKTTALHMCNSVYGKPDALCLIKEDTGNAKIMRVGIYNNIPPTFDEMTNSTPQDLSMLAYSITQGKGKDRVKQSANELRHNATRWNCIALCSSNSSFYEKLASLKASPDGEMMRIIEYKIEPTTAIDQAYAKEMFDHQLMENYGHAGDIYASWLVNNHAEAKATALEIQAKVDRELKLTQRERFWSAIIAANFTGGLIARNYLNLIDWDMKAIYVWATKMINEIRTETPESAVVTSTDALGDFILRHMQNILCVNSTVDKRATMHLQAMPTMEPRGDLIIRVEPDTKKMFITAKALRDDCVDNQVSYRELVKMLELKGIMTGLEVKRMSKGTKISAPGVQAIVLDTTHQEFMDLSGIIPDDTAGD